MFEREDREGIVTLRLSHGKASAMDLELMEGLEKQLDELAGPSTRAVILTGTGSIFSAGVDLFRVVNEGDDYVARFLPRLASAIRKLFEFPKPVVAATNGHAIAGGCILVAACDYRLMSAGTGRIGVPELLVGVPFPAFAIEVVRFVVPRERLQEVVYTGRTFLPDEAREKGLVDEVVEASLLESRSLEIAHQLASIPPESFRLTKRQLRVSALSHAEHLGSWSDAEALAVWSSPATRERIGQYLEKTVGRKA
jgi:enoyl-CoA hydratase